MMIIVVIYIIINIIQTTKTDHLNPYEADSHPKTSGKLRVSSASFESQYVRVITYDSISIL